MRDHPFVSVIIPTYNRAHLIVEAIESVLAQTYRNLEVIVVDDGSTDKTPEVLEHYTGLDRRVRLVRQDNRGVAAARNRGLAHTTGELIAFCDSDDLWLPHKLERQVAFLQEHAEVTLVYSDVMSVQDQIVEVPSYFAERPPHAGRVFHALLEMNFIPTSSVVVRKRCLDEVGGFDGRFSPSEDYELWLRVCQREPIGYVPEVLVRLRRFGDNLTSDGQQFETHVAVLNRLQVERREVVSTRVLRRAYARTYLQWGYEQLQQRHYAQARASLFRSLRYNPVSWRVYRYLVALALPAGTLDWMLTRRRVSAAMMSQPHVTTEHGTRHGHDHN